MEWDAVVRWVRYRCRLGRRSGAAAAAAVRPTEEGQHAAEPPHAPFSGEGHVGADDGTGEAWWRLGLRGLRPVPSPHPTPPPAPLRAPARACGAGALRHARHWRASRAFSPRGERGFITRAVGVRGGGRGGEWASKRGQSKRLQRFGQLAVAGDGAQGVALPARVGVGFPIEHAKHARADAVAAAE